MPVDHVHRQACVVTVNTYLGKAVIRHELNLPNVLLVHSVLSVTAHSDVTYSAQRAADVRNSRRESSQRESKNIQLL